MVSFGIPANSLRQWLDSQNLGNYVVETNISSYEVSSGVYQTAFLVPNLRFPANSGYPFVLARYNHTAAVWWFGGAFNPFDEARVMLPDDNTLHIEGNTIPVVAAVTQVPSGGVVSQAINNPLSDTEAGVALSSTIFTAFDHSVRYSQIRGVLYQNHLSHLNWHDWDLIENILVPDAFESEQVFFRTADFPDGFIGVVRPNTADVYVRARHSLGRDEYFEVLSNSADMWLPAGDPSRHVSAGSSPKKVNMGRY